LKIWRGDLEEVAEESGLDENVFFFEMVLNGGGLMDVYIFIQTYKLAIWMEVLGRGIFRARLPPTT
jgi:hypothetical protein